MAAGRDHMAKRRLRRRLPHRRDSRRDRPREPRSSTAPAPIATRGGRIAERRTERIKHASFRVVEDDAERVALAGAHRLTPWRRLTRYAPRVPFTGR